ncbi:MAG: polyprenyl synthetase family protein [Prevotella sp.]|nr:polyprenyl synthetase family protein [Prevotella sp.]
MDNLSIIKQPIATELDEFIALFNQAMTHSDGMLSSALSFIKQKSGKRMRPILILLIAKSFGKISEVTQNAAVGLELLHTASLVHDDVVDESERRRGQASVNAIYDNKVAVLVGDYILSTALLYVSHTHSESIVRYLAELGRTLSDGEILQLTNIRNQIISEDVYFKVISQKTAALFEACCVIGASSSGATETQIEQARVFGRNLGIIFQIKDDIFDYYESSDIGKPTGNDLAEGKLTLPVIYALNSTGNQDMLQLARKVKDGTVTPSEIDTLVAFAKENGGIEYAEKRMCELHDECHSFIDKHVKNDSIKAALEAYLDFVIKRKL